MCESDKYSMKIVCLKGGLGNQLFEYCRYCQLLEEGKGHTYLYYDPRRLKSHAGALITEGFNVTLPQTPLWVQLLVHGIKDSFDAAVARGVNVDKFWQGSPISNFTILPTNGN